MIKFHVVNKETGEKLKAKGFWAIDQDGDLVDVIDGWGCEGGGGSSKAPCFAMVVLGEYEEKPINSVSLEVEKPYRCQCGKRFVTLKSAYDHATTTTKKGCHVIID